MANFIIIYVTQQWAFIGKTTRVLKTQESHYHNLGIHLLAHFLLKQVQVQTNLKF